MDESINSEQSIEEDDKVTREEKLNEILRLFYSSYTGPVPPELWKKIDKDVLLEILKLSKEDLEEEYKDRKHQRNYTLLLIVISGFLFIAVTYIILTLQPSVYADIIKIAVGFVGGIGVGYSWGKYKGIQE